MLFIRWAISKNDRKDFHGHRKFANEVLAKANGLPIAAHRYQTASSLWFYTEARACIEFEFAFFAIRFVEV